MGHGKVTLTVLQQFDGAACDMQHGIAQHGELLCREILALDVEPDVQIPGRHFANLAADLLHRAAELGVVGRPAGRRGGAKRHAAIRDVWSRTWTIMMHSESPGPPAS